MIALQHTYLTFPNYLLQFVVMKPVFHKKTFKIPAALLLAGVFLCLAGPTMAASGDDAASGPTSCQTMAVNLASTSDRRLFGAFALVTFALLFIRALKPGWENLAQQTATALGPPPGSRWRLFQHAFFDTIYRLFSPARQYAAVIVEPQTYSA